MKKILFGFLLVFGSISYGQSVTGTSGLIHIPSARMLEDGQLVLGAAYIPKGIYYRTYGPNKFITGANPGLNTYVTYGILPFVEVMFRYSHELNMPVNIETQYFPDRMLSLRIRIINENEKIPSIVFGIHDITQFVSGVTGVPNFSANYLVFSKIFEVKNILKVDLNIGYSFDIQDFKSKDYKGFFGGLSLTPNFYKRISFILEHNSKGINSGINWNPFRPINLMVGVWDLNKPTFSFNYLF